MPLRTQLFQQMPWVGGVNTSTDESLIQPNQLVQADNVIFDFRGSRKKRDGISYNFGSRPVTTSNEFGLFEFWFDNLTDTAKQRWFLSQNDLGQIFRYTAGGTAVQLGDNGIPWSGLPDQFSTISYNNRAMMAAVGPGNLIKEWDGIAANVSTLRNIYGHSIAGPGRSSNGLIRTLILDSTFKGLPGDYVVVQTAAGANASFYNGTFKVTQVLTTNVNLDTILFTATTSLTESGIVDASMVIDGTAPQGSILRQHLGRMWTNDKNNKDRVNFSGTNNQYQWTGQGDSSSLDIGIGDGDPEGVTAIFPSFQGTLFVAKKTKLYRIDGTSPDTFSISLVSNGIGCIAHNSIAQVDQTDMFFVSERGIHSMSTSANFGDFEAAFLSADIQATFNENFSKPNLKHCQAAYLPEINSVAFVFNDTNLPNASKTNLSVNNSVWLYNIQFKAWYRWPDVPCQSLIVAADGDKKRFYFGTHTGKVIKSFTGNFYDLDYTGTKIAIRFLVVTGQLTMDQNFYTVKGFKRFLFFYKPQGNAPVNVTVQIDNLDQDPVNQLAFNEQPLGPLLGVNFILGQTVLGLTTAKLASYTRSIDGFGRSVKITIDESSITQPLEIQGFGVEWEPAGTSPEVIAK